MLNVLARGVFVLRSHARGDYRSAAGMFLSYANRGHPSVSKELFMLKYAIIFAVVSLIAGALGFGGIAAGAAGIAKVLFGLFLILAVVFLVLAALGVGAVRKAID